MVTAASFHVDMARATFTDHNSQICFTLLAFCRCILGGRSNLGNGFAHLLIVRGDDLLSLADHGLQGDHFRLDILVLVLLLNLLVPEAGDVAAEEVLSSAFSFALHPC